MPGCAPASGSSPSFNEPTGVQRLLTRLREGHLRIRPEPHIAAATVQLVAKHPRAGAGRLDQQIEAAHRAVAVPTWADVLTVRSVSLPIDPHSFPRRDMDYHGSGLDGNGRTNV